MSYQRSIIWLQKNKILHGEAKTSRENNFSVWKPFTYLYKMVANLMVVVPITLQ